MSIFRLQHVGTAVADFDRVSTRLKQLGLPTRDFRNDQGRGFQHDSRVLLGNECWLHIVHNWNPEARVHQFLKRCGEGLEHLALESDDIEADVARLRELGVPLFEDKIFDANDGYEAFVFPEDGIGFTVELIQPHVKSWAYPDDARGRAVSPDLGVTRAAEVRAEVEDVSRATEKFEKLFGLQASNGLIPLGNADLQLVPASGREHLSRLTLETATLEADIEFLSSADARMLETHCFDSELGFGIELRAAEQPS